jgi:hypothetical protein
MQDTMRIMREKCGTADLKLKRVFKCICEPAVDVVFVVGGGVVTDGSGRLPRRMGQHDAKPDTSQK